MKPVVNAQLLGGQYYYKGSESSFGGLASLSVSPYTKVNDHWSVVPLYSGYYQGTKQVTDLIGGGTLFQDSQNHAFSSKVIRSWENGIKAKAIGGYAIEWLRETKDESWTKGLYDNRRLSGGTELEWSWAKDQFVRIAYDYYKIHFPNYQSLESQQTTTGLGRELAQPNVLDNGNHALSLAGQWMLPWHGLLEVSVSDTFRHYGDQHLTVASGDLSSDVRNDSILMFSTQGTWPVAEIAKIRLFSTLGYSWTHLMSDQNHYDASKTFFNPNYYAYITHSLQNRWTALVGEKPWTLNLSWSLARQSYSDRLVQDNEGTYGTDTTHVDSATVGLGVGYPIAEGFKLNATAYWGWSDSNNTNSKVYQYHYDTAAYLFGFSYAY